MPATTPKPRRPRSGNRRDETARLAVLHAADDLLVEHGFGALTVQAIARRAGVAKQTIYRWWPSKTDILLDTLIEDIEKSLPVPTRDATAETLRAYFHDTARFLAHDAAGAVLLALTAQAQLDSAMAANFQVRYLGPRREQERELLARAVDAGEISPVLDADAAIDAVVGPLVYRALAGRTLPHPLVDTLFDELLKPRAH